MATLLITGAAGAVSFVTILGNLLVLLSIRANHHLQTVNNYFLFSLACADLLMGVFSMNVYTAYVLAGHWPFGPLMCPLWLVVDYVVSNASNTHLLLISVDRYLCVTRPFSFPPRRTRRYAALMLLAAWLLSLALWAPAILAWQRLHGQQRQQRDQCYIQLLSSPAVTMATAILSFYLPAALMTLLYTRISRAGRRHADHRHADRHSYSPESAGVMTTSHSQTCAPTHTTTPTHTPTHSQTCAPTHTTTHTPSHSQTHTHTPTHSQSCGAVRKRRGGRASLRERKLTRTVLAVLLAFLLTWTPYNILALMGTFCHSCVWDLLWTCAYWLRYLSSTLNPLCYALCSATFRNTFRNLLLCRYKNISSK